MQKIQMQKTNLEQCCWTSLLQYCNIHCQSDSIHKGVSEAQIYTNTDHTEARKTLVQSDNTGEVF